MDEKFEIQIEIKNIDLSIILRFIKDNLTFEDISMGFWYKDETSMDKVFSPFFMADSFFILLEGLGYWVNDEFVGILPFSLIRDVTEYRTDILKDKFKKTELILNIRSITNNI
jgi:hypothetical protein